MSNLPIYCWDSCVFIALITDEETRTPAEKQGILDILDKISRKEAILITSAATRAEVLECDLDIKQKKIFESVFYRKNILKAETTNRVWDLAHDIRNHHKQLKKNKDVKSIKLADSIHLATAILHMADELHTFDEKLLSISGNVAGHNLIIKKPALSQTTLGLV